MTPNTEHEARLERDRTYYRDTPASHGWRHPETGQVFGVADLRGGISQAVKYADDLARKNSEALSFIPRPRLEWYAERGRLLLEFENGDPCGFLIHGTGNRMKVYQACVQYDARRREHGLRLVAKLIEKAIANQSDCISLWCANDLDANEFWRLAGFTLVGQRDGGKRRGRVHNQWVLTLPSPLLHSDTYDPSLPTWLLLGRPELAVTPERKTA